MGYPRIVIMSPIHNKKWLLSYFLRAISKIDYPNKETIFLSNNNDKSIIALLEEYGEVYEYNEVESTAERTSGRYHSLVKIRNKMLDIAFRDNDFDYMFSLDSDVLVVPEIVKNLLSFEKDFIGALVWNDLHFARKDKPNHIGNIMNLRGAQKNHFKHIQPIIRNVLIPVDMTGAVALMSKKVYLSGVRYQYHQQGEDPGFAIECHKREIQQWSWTSLQLHAMTKKVLQEYILDGIIEEIKEK